ncbi:ABC transporter substrate-binding protein [Hoyosella subflava]|uniref:Aliphatic sulfonates family ABC transporter, periplasmic ligand-binding protein n=1 Tax=Hoyosella subflava (strain DSM 45089 / JCM 17490 / NBRC 109087 / DQS3-9A1) TaxID=443218 RepID=F6EGS5_HOYSD|nr:ABC transporter substrate-binding protein [Hoyosella subflava]AEF42313.1 Aliphatic sulfonates family ABC transporter, periplasmic ligand-binding protein [Hoyosella subflava DQS3-9A1]
MKMSRKGGRWSVTARLVAVVLGLGLAVSGCTSAHQNEGAAAGSVVRVGMFPNVTHAPALVGVENGLLQDALGDDVELEVHYFNAGGEAAQALLAGAIDLTYIGPNPAINAFQRSNGEAVRLVSGSTSGGAFFVVRDGIDGPEDLQGATLASPQPIGNTQDVALRAWLAEQGLQTDTRGGGDVSIRSMANADVLQAFQQGDLDGAWVPEPWATRLIDEAGGKVLIDERDLWPNGQYVTTHILASTSFLDSNPEIVRAILSAHLDALDFVNANPDEAQTIALDGIENAIGTRLSAELIAAAWQNLEFTPDPIASSLQESADDAIAAGLLEPVDLDGIYDLAILNELLRERSAPEVSDS